MKRFAHLVPMLLAFGAILGLIAGAVWIINTLEAGLDHWSPSL